MAVERWRLLQVGSCRHPEIMARKGGHICAVDFPALVGLIWHDTFGPILFDTGYHRRFFAATEPFPERLYRLTTPVQYDESQSLETQLAALDLQASDIKGIFVSHFHGDHVAGLEAFPQAKIFCARDGLMRTREGGRFTRVRQGLLSALIPTDIDKRASFFEDGLSQAIDLGPFSTGLDLIGDASLLAVELPGHCCGHWGLWVRPPSGPSPFFIGDAAWSLEAVTDNIPPPALTTTLLGNTRIYRDTLSNLNVLSKTRPDIAIIPSHCPATAKTWLDHG